jgi:hypothetical protein
MPGPNVMHLEGFGKLKNVNDLIGSQTHDLRACTTVPQPAMLPHAYLHM